MSFEDLPEDWPMRSLSDPSLACDVVDLVVSAADRDAGGIGFLLCGQDGRLQQPVFAQGGTPAAELAAEETGAGTAIGVATGVLARQSDDGGPPGSVLFVIARSSGGLTDVDRQWHQRAIEHCRESGVRLLGVALATLSGVEALPESRSGAAGSAA